MACIRNGLKSKMMVRSYVLRRTRLPRKGQNRLNCSAILLHRISRKWTSW